MTNYVEQISTLDISLFNNIPTQTTILDRKSLLLLQNCVRGNGSYVYLEIGSHLGGSISPHYCDPLCKLIYSIDMRPLIQPDERGRDYEYEDNSSAKMLNNLQNAFPSIPIDKVKVFDQDAKDVNNADIVERPNLCFIDGEHTNIAVYNDFMFCLEVCEMNGVIVFHDSKTVCKGIEKIRTVLTERSIRHKGIMLGGSVYAILLDNAIEKYSEKLKPYCRNELLIFTIAKILLLVKRINNRINR